MNYNEKNLFKFNKFYLIVIIFSNNSFAGQNILNIMYLINDTK